MAQNLLKHKHMEWDDIHEQSAMWNQEEMR